MTKLQNKFNIHLISGTFASLGSFGSFGSFYLSGGLFSFQMDKKNRRGFVSGGGTNPVIPIMSYTNLLIQKKQILKDNKGKSGIYR